MNIVQVVHVIYKKTAFYRIFDDAMKYEVKYFSNNKF